MTRLRAAWNQHFLLLEGLIGIAALLALVIWAREYGGACIILETLKGNRSAIYSTLASIFASLLGFAITAASIVITAHGSERMSILRNSPHYRTLWRVYIQAIIVLSYATVAALIALLADRESSPHWTPFYLCAGGVIFAVLRLYRCVWIMIQIIYLFILQPK